MFGSLFRNIPDVVKNLLIINVLLFVATLIFSDSDQPLDRILGMYYFGSDAFEPYQIVTHMFMHGSLMHLFFNMFGLVMFGSILERNWGPKRFLMFYFITGLGAAALHTTVNYFQVTDALNSIAFPIDVAGHGMVDSKKALIEYMNTGGRDLLLSQRNFVGTLGDINLIYNIQVVGASGAIFGLLMAFAMLHPNTELMLMFIPFPIKAKYFVPIYMLIELYLGVNNFEWDNIAHFAHLGGAFFGLIMVLIWRKDRRNFY